MCNKLNFPGQQEITNLFNSIFDKHSIPITIREYVDLNIDPVNHIISWNRTDRNRLLAQDKISQYLEQKVFKTIDTCDKIFYHFLPCRSYYESIIDTGKIRLYSLEKYNKNGIDPDEFTLFLEENKIEFPGGQNQIPAFKDSIFIFSLAYLPTKKYLEECAKKEKGVLTSVKFKMWNDTDGITNLVKVCYDIPFLKELVTKLEQDFKMILKISNFLLFAEYYKDKDGYSWENEVRLSLNGNKIEPHLALENFVGYQHDYSEILYELFEIKKEEETGYSFIEFPIQNKLFECEFNEITRGEFNKLAISAQ